MALTEMNTTNDSMLMEHLHTTVLLLIATDKIGGLEH